MPSRLVMSKFSRGALHSGSKSGPVVRSKKQALAIMLSEKRAEDSGMGPDDEAASYKRGRKPTRRKS